MPEIHRWWINRPEERYWLEVTDRPELGINLKAPQTNERATSFGVTRSCVLFDPAIPSFTMTVLNLRSSRIQPPRGSSGTTRLSGPHVARMHAALVLSLMNATVGTLDSNRTRLYPPP